MKRCGKKYGKRRQLTCKRPEGHEGKHALRMTLDELRRSMSKP